MLFYKVDVTVAGIMMVTNSCNLCYDPVIIEQLRLDCSFDEIRKFFECKIVHGFSIRHVHGKFIRRGRASIND
jgi:hypothetical protein